MKASRQEQKSSAAAGARVGSATVAVESEADTISSSRPSVWMAVLFFTLLTAVMTWPQVLHPASVPDNVDSYFNMWRLAWVAHQLPRDPLHLFDANIFYPLRHTLAYSDAVLLQGVASAPLLWLGVPVVFVYNLLIFGSFVLCATGMFLLVRDLTGRADAALISGIVFAFAPYRFDHYFHLELLWAPWMPLSLWMLHRTLKSGRLRDGVWTGVFVAAQGLSCIYYTVFFATVLVAFVPVLLVGRLTRSHRRAVLALIAGAVLAAAILVPYMLPYRAARAEIGEREAGFVVLYAAGPKHYLAAMPQSLLYGRLTGPLGRHEKRLFPGVAVVLLVAIGLWPPLDRTRLAYAVALAVAVDISFGFRGLLFGWLREHVMFYRGLRVPARVGQQVLLGLAVLGGFGVSRLAAWFREHRPTWSAVAVASLGGVIICEYLMLPVSLVAVETTPSPVYRWLLQQPPGVVAEFPMPGQYNLPFHDAEYDYLSTFHWRPLVNGYSGMYPAAYNRLVTAIGGFPSDASLAALRAAGVDFLIVHERFYDKERYRSVTRALDERDDVAAYGPFADGPFAIRAYRLLPLSRGGAPRF